MNKLLQMNEQQIHQVIDSKVQAQVAQHLKVAQQKGAFSPKGFGSFFTHTITFSALAAGASNSGEIKIDTDADFFWYKAAYFADIAAAAQTDGTRVIPLVTVLVTDTGSARQLQSAATPIPSLFGTGEIPFILPAPHKFKAGSNISVDVTNFDAAATYNLRLQFIGFKKFLNESYQD